MLKNFQSNLKLTLAIEVRQTVSAQEGGLGVPEK